ncbi:MAG: PDZ domain-containing protein, partial [Planctomycetota bacterium]
EYGLLGISFSVSARSKTTDGRYGIAVQQAYAGGPAGRAGLRSRDIITDVAGEPTPNADRLQLLVGQQPPGKSLQVSFERDGVQRTADVSLSKHYTLGQKIVTTPAPRWRGILVDYATAVSQTDLERASREGLIDPQGCVVVADVTPDSVSWEQGVRPGMFISHVGGDRVSTPAEFWTAVEQADASVKVRFTQTLGEPNE